MWRSRDGRSTERSKGSADYGKRPDGRHGLLDGCFAGLREMGGWDNGQCVICGNLRYQRTGEKAGTDGPLITLIMDARNLRTAWTCGRARDETTGGA
jgi:hypothetical protein